MDVLVTVAPKDFNKMKFNHAFITQNVIGVENVIYVSPITIPEEYLPAMVQTWTDAQVCDFDFYRINMTHRQGWYRQQFIKLFQEVTSDDYLVVDADTFICKPLNIDIDNPTFYLGRDQMHQPYFDLIKAIVNLDRVYSHSFISEVMYFKRSVINDMLTRLGLTAGGFFDACVEHINKAGYASGFSEYELYGNYVTKYFDGMYQYQHIKVLSKALKREWTDSELEVYITRNKDFNFDLLVAHSWV